MKKFLSMFLALGMILALTACSDTPEPTTGPVPDTTQPSSAAPTEPSQTPTQPETEETTLPEIRYDLPMTAISITRQTETTNGKDGNPVFEYIYPNIRLVLPDTDRTMEVNLDILNRIDATRAVAANLMNDALAENPRYPYSFTVIYEPQRLDSSILSLFGSQRMYNGGSVFYSGHGMTYDLTTGELLTLADILYDTVTADILCPLVVEALASLPAEYYIFDDFSTTVEDRFAVDFRADAGWHLSDDGLCFTFLPFEVAPNSTGFVHALIPYEKLTGILRDEWFPPEQVTADGSLEALEFTDTVQYGQIAELNLDAVGGTYVLHATGLIYDVKIETGFWNMDGTEFTPEETVLWRKA